MIIPFHLTRVLLTRSLIKRLLLELNIHSPLLKEQDTPLTVGSITANKQNITENTTLIAKWEVNKYTVTLNASGGTVAQPSVEVTYGEKFTLPVATNEYGAFIGWFYGETQITDPQGNSLKQRKVDKEE